MWLSDLCGRTYSHQEQEIKSDYEKIWAELVERVKWVIDEDLEAHLAKAMGHVVVTSWTDADKRREQFH